MLLMAENKSRFNGRKSYIEGLNNTFAPYRDFDSIEYVRNFMLDKEYIKLSTLLGVNFFDISDLTLAEVLKDICKYLLMGEIETPEILPDSLIRDPEDMIEIAEMFIERREDVPQV